MSCIAVSFVLREFFFYLFELRRNSTTSSFNVGLVFTMDDSVICEAFSVEGQLEFSGCLAVCAPSILKRETKKKRNNFKWLVRLVSQSFIVTS